MGEIEIKPHTDRIPVGCHFFVTTKEIMRHMVDFLNWNRDNENFKVPFESARFTSEEVIFYPSIPEYFTRVCKFIPKSENSLALEDVLKISCLIGSIDTLKDMEITVLEKRKDTISFLLVRNKNGGE